MAKIAGEGEGKDRGKRESEREEGRQWAGVCGGCGAAAIGLRQELECE